ncbi:hypothetical protein, partial [Natronospira sp.]
MRKTSLLSLMGLTLAVASAPAAAFFGDAEGERYYVAKVNNVQLDADDSSDATSIAFAFGQYLGERQVAASESEIGITVSNGSVSNSGFLGGSSEADWELLHLGSFIAFQNPGDFKIKGKLGFAFTQLEVGNNTEQDFSAAYGIGGVFGPVEV